MSTPSIKGIAVELGAETTGLDKALSDVNKKSKDLQGELKQVERLLKLDPTNTELVAQKQKLLQDAVANSKDKLDKLRAAQEQVNQQFQKGDISEEQYRAFQREVAKAEQELSKFENKLKETGKEANKLGDNLKDAGERMKDIGDNVKGVGEKMSVGLSAPVVAAGGLMLKGAVDAENAMGKLQASLGLTAEEAADLEAVAQAVWKNGFGENIEEVNLAITSVRQNIGDLAEDDMQTVAEGAMTIADVFDQDVNEVTRAAGVAMKNFGIDGQEAMDLITYGFQHGGNYSDELLDTIREYSPQFASMGLSADQSMAMLISGAQAGAWNLDKVGDAVKEFNIRAQDGSKTTAEGFKAIGLDASKMGADIAKGGEGAQKAFMATVTALASMKDPMAQNQAGVALFGTQWEDVRSQVIIAMAEGVKGLDNFKGANAEAAKAAYDNNPGAALTMAMRELQAAIGPALLPLADVIKTTIVPAIKSLAEWFSNLSPAGKTTVLAIVGIVAAIGPLLLIIGSLVSSVGAIIGAFAAAGVAIAEAGGIIAFGIGIITSPVTIAIAAIAALIAIGVLLYKNWDTIKETLSATWDGIKTIATAVWGGIKQVFTDFAETIKLLFMSIYDSIHFLDFSYFTDMVGEIFGRRVQQIFVKFGEFIENTFNFIKKFFQQWGATILLIAVGPAGWAVLLAQKLAQNWDKIKQTAITIWNSIKTGISNVWNSIKSGISGAIGSVLGTVKMGLENVWNYIKSIPNKALQWGKNIISALVRGIKNTHIPMPHFKFSIDYKSIAGASFPVPSVGVKWYGEGAIFTSPQIVGIGEAGPEAVIPIDKLEDIIKRTQQKEVQQNSVTINNTFTGSWTIRNESDIRQISRELHNLQLSELRGTGAGRNI